MGAGEGDSHSYGYELGKGLAESVHASSQIQVLSDASAMAVYQGNMVTVHQGERIVKLRAGQVVVAAGAQESPPIFPNNDLPGIMLSSGALRLVNLYGVTPGARGVVVTDSDEGLKAAIQLMDAGVNLAVVADSRLGHTSQLASSLEERDVSLLQGWRVVKAEGGKGLKSVLLESMRDGSRQSVECDFLCLAPTPDPVTVLLSYATPNYPTTDLGASVPADLARSIMQPQCYRNTTDAGNELCCRAGWAGLEVASACGVGFRADSEDPI